MTTTKRGGARPGAGQPRKPADQAVSVRFSLALTPAEADEYRRRGATAWVRSLLQTAGPTDAGGTMHHHATLSLEGDAIEFCQSQPPASQPPASWWVVCLDEDDAHVHQRSRPDGIVLGPFETHDDLMAFTYNRPYGSDWIGHPKCDVCRKD